MKLTRICTVITAIAIIAGMTGCKNKEQIIPAVNETNIAETVETLGVSTEDFEAFLSNIGMTYDEYIDMLNRNDISLSDMKKDIETNYECTYEEYIKTIITVNNRDAPDENEYIVFKSQYSMYDVYIHKDELDNTKTKLVNYDIQIESVDTSSDVYAFDAIVYSASGDFKTYMQILNQEYGCSSVELTNMSIFGGHGVKKPAGKNACMDRLFVYDKKTNEILEKIAVPVITLRNDDENKNVTLALSEDIGLIFKTTGPDSYEKMLKLSNLDIQIRTADMKQDK